ncbi:MAG: aryl-sulfate sulfotransferase [Myxococcota bacterium]
MRGWWGLVLVGCAGGGDGTKPDATTDTDDPQTTELPTGSTPTTTPEACTTSVSLAAAPGSTTLEARLTVTLDAPNRVWVLCTSPDDPLEQHLLEGEGPALQHELLLRGVLPETSYSCEAHVPCGDVSDSASFASGALDPALPALTVSLAPGEALTGAYTLFNDADGCGGGASNWVAMADPEGRIRWAYPVGDDLVADVDVYLMGPDRVHIGGGWGLFSFGQGNRGVFRDIDLSGQVLLERETPDVGLGFNHHSEPMADGSYLSITGDRDGSGNDEWNGVGIELWHPDDGVRWSWTSQGLVDDGYITQPSPFDPLPYHANAVSLVTDALGDAAWISDFGYEELWRIDRATGALTHVFGHGGDFELVDTAGQPLPDSEYPYVQHGPDYVDDRVLLYDNGQGRPGGSYSRVAEYELDLTANVATLLWSWTEPGFDYPILGDADYLDAGRVLVAKGANRCLDPFGTGASEVLELQPEGGSARVIWRMTWPDRSHAIYRAQRYGGCDVFANARYCPTVAARIAELRRLTQRATVHASAGAAASCQSTSVRAPNSSRATQTWPTEVACT